MVTVLFFLKLVPGWTRFGLKNLYKLKSCRFTTGKNGALWFFPITFFFKPDISCSFYNTRFSCVRKFPKGFNSHGNSNLCLGTPEAKAFLAEWSPFFRVIIIKHILWTYLAQKHLIILPSRMVKQLKLSFI